MRIAVFGATGRTGREVLREAIARGHTAVGVSRHPPAEAVAAGAAIEWRAADVLDAARVREALRGVEAAVVCIGPSSGDDVTCGRGTEVILDAMRALKVGRIACVTGAMIGHDPARLGWILRRIRASFRANHRAQAADRDAQERALQSSGIATTIVRPTRLAGGARTRATVSSDAFVSTLASSRRADVAAALIDGVEGRLDREGETVRGVVVLSRPSLFG